MTNNTAATIGASYFAAWSAGNVDKATEYLTDDWGFFIRSSREFERFRSPYQSVEVHDSVPFGKLFHIFQRPAQIGVSFYKDAASRGEQALCRRCGRPS